MHESEHSRVCYFVNQYPKVSHTFIKREIRALEEQGVFVLRVAARMAVEELVDECDLAEVNRTIEIARDIKALIKSAVLLLPRSPLKFFSALKAALWFGFNDRCRFLHHVVYLLEACRLAELCCQHKIDHVHSHFGTNATNVALLCYLLGGPEYSFTVHGPEEFDKPFQLSLREKIQHAKFVVAITSFCKSQLYRHCDYSDWPKIKIVHCGVDSRTTLSPVPVTVNNGHVVNIGRLSEQKGQMLLLQGVKALRDEGVDLTLHLVGDGELRPMINDFIKANDLNDAVVLHGYLGAAEIRNLLDDSIGLVLPSFAEGLPVVIMEALARQRPVLTTYIAGIPELITPANGWLVPAGELNGLIAALKALCAASPEKLNSMGQAGYDCVVRDFNCFKEASKLLAAIRE